MEKEGIILVLAILLLLSISLVSASFWNDFWSKITGRVIEENITAEPVAENIAVECTDSDGGLDYYTKGTVTFSEGTVTDTCVSGKLTEWICDERNIAEDEYYTCPYGCSDGVCLKEPAPSTQQCRDSDDGKNYYVVGSVSIGAEGEPWAAPIRDSCIDKFTLEEGYCENGNMLSEKYKCTNGCEDGACIREEEPKPPVPETPPTEVVHICAAKIKITLNKEIYYYRDYLKVEVEIFDSQGNRIPNYPFYFQTYTYNDGIWHTPGEQITDKNGYFIVEGTVEEGKQGLGKSKLKVYTPNTGAYVNCNFVEDSITAEIKKGEKEEVCGIGVCVPEEGKKVEEIPEEKMLYSCSGCKLEGKCYPIGYRKAGQYCTPDYEFVNQIEEGKCENNFECKSNVCISEECVSESLMKKIINWFKKLFGKEEPGESELIEPKAEMCSDWLIEKNIGDYKYSKSAYGHAKESQVPLYSEDGEQIGIVKCCVAGYLELDGESKGISALVCPYDNKVDIENSLKWLSARGELTLGEYKGQKVYKVGNAMIWTHKEFIIAVGPDPKTTIPFSEEIANAYLDKYPNDLESVEIPKVPPTQIQGGSEKFLDEAKKLGEVTLIDFETKPDGTILQAEQKLSGKEWESLGVVFEAPSEEYLKLFGPLYPFNPLDKLSLSPGLGPYESGSDTHDDLNIIFSEPVKAAGIYLLDLGGTDERESIAFLDENGNVLYKISPWPKSTFGNPAPGTFVSFISEKGISKIEILENTQDGDDIAYDNLYFVK